jgi:hypothetical protein
VTMLKKLDLPSRQGDHWSINIKTGRGTFDPKFFVKRDSRSREHVANLPRNRAFPRLKKIRKPMRIFTKTEKGTQVDLLYCYINNIMANREENDDFRPIERTLEYLYEDKLFPRINYVNLPGISFIYALCERQALPREN